MHSIDNLQLGISLTMHLTHLTGSFRWVHRQHIQETSKRKLRNCACVWFLQLTSTVAFIEKELYN